MEIGLFRYADELGYGTANLSQIEIVGPSVEDVTIAFKPHETAELQFQWQDAEAGEYLAAD